MSMEYRAVIVLGAPYDIFHPEVKKKIEACWDDSELDRIAPYFDAPNQDCLVGIILRNSGDYAFECFEDSPIEADEKLAAYRKFHRLTGVPPKLYVSVDAY